MSERAKPLLYGLAIGAAVAAALLAASFFFLAGSLAHAATMLNRVSMCVVSLAETRTLPLGLMLPMLLALGSVVSLARGLHRYRRERRLVTSLPLEPVSEGELGDAARAAGIDVYRTPASRPAAFCFGLLRPRIVFTSGLLDRLSNEEQVAALWHEAQHARVREPLRCLIARLVTSTFFWLPILRDVFNRYTLVRELDADRSATCRTSAGALAGALHEVVAAPPLVGAVGFRRLRRRSDRPPARSSRATPVALQTHAHRPQHRRSRPARPRVHLSRERTGLEARPLAADDDEGAGPHPIGRTQRTRSLRHVTTLGRRRRLGQTRRDRRHTVLISDRRALALL